MRAKLLMVASDADFGEDDGGQFSPALQAVYNGLDPDTVELCEKARHSLRDTYVSNLRLVRDALAKAQKAGSSDRTFKAWCTAVGINYRTAQSAIRRAEEREARNRDSDESRDSNGTGNGDDDPEPEPEPEPEPAPPPDPNPKHFATAKFTLTVKDRNKLYHCLRSVQFGRDARMQKAELLMVLVDQWMEAHPETLANVPEPEREGDDDEAA